MKIMLEDSYLHAVFKVRRFLFSAFLLTLEIVETLRTKIFSWYIEIYNASYTKASLRRNKTHREFLTYFFQKIPVVTQGQDDMFQ